MLDILNASDSRLAAFLFRRIGAPCTMCRRIMRAGYCTDKNCSTYPATLASVFINRCRRAVANFRKSASLEFIANKLVSGGQFESKRRAH